MKWLSILALVLAFLAVEGIAAAQEADVDVTVTPNLGSVGCPTGLDIDVESAYELDISWTEGFNTEGTLVKAAYGRDVGNSSDGFTVYEGNATSYTHWINTEFVSVDIYYRLYGILGGGTYTECSIGGAVTGGEALTEIGTGLSAIADYIKLGLMLGVPLLLGLIGVRRHSLTCYLCGMLGLIITLSVTGDTLGSAVTIPLFILIVGLLGATVRDALNRDLILI